MNLEITCKDIMIFTKGKGNLGKWPQDIPVLMRTMAADVKNPLARRSHFDRHNECHIGGIWTSPFASTWPNRLPGNISTVTTCVGTRNWSTRKLSEISASCWCFNGQFWPQDTPNPQKGHNRSTQTKERFRLICNTITVGPKLSLF
jgi:hypothetical protein